MRANRRASCQTAESAELFALHLEARIGALTRIQGALVTAGVAGVDLEELIRAELLASTGYDASMIPAQHADTLRLEKPVDLDALCRAVESCCL